MLLLQPLGAVDFAKHAEMQLNRPCQDDRSLPREIGTADLQFVTSLRAGMVWGFRTTGDMSDQRA